MSRTGSCRSRVILASEPRSTSRIVAGKLSLDVRAVDLSAVIEGALSIGIQSSRDVVDAMTKASGTPLAALRVDGGVTPTIA